MEIVSASKNPVVYNDIRRVLDAALRAGGGVYRLPSASKARTFMQRAGMFRNLLAEIDRKGRLDGQPGQTPYDDIKFTRTCGCGYRPCQRRGSCTGNEVVISTEPLIEGRLFNGSGEEVKIELNKTLQVEVHEDVQALAAAKRSIREHFDE